ASFGGPHRRERPDQVRARVQRHRFQRPAAGAAARGGCFVRAAKRAGRASRTLSGSDMKTTRNVLLMLCAALVALAAAPRPPAAAGFNFGDWQIKTGELD